MFDFGLILAWFLFLVETLFISTDIIIYAKNRERKHFYQHFLLNIKGTHSPLFLVSRPIMNTFFEHQ